MVAHICTMYNNRWSASWLPRGTCKLAQRSGCAQPSGVAWNPGASGQGPGYIKASCKNRSMRLAIWLILYLSIQFISKFPVRWYRNVENSWKLRGGSKWEDPPESGYWKWVASGFWGCNECNVGTLWWFMSFCFLEQSLADVCRWRAPSVQGFWWLCLVVLSSLDVPDCDHPLYYLYHYISLDFGGNHSPRPSIYIWMVTWICGEIHFVLVV